VRISKIFLTLLIFSFVNTFSLKVHAALSLPSGLTEGEQQLVLQILAFPTSFRPVDNPYPLGGYSGLEFGISFESIPTGDIGYFGAGAAVDRNIIYPRLTLGKGIFSSTDLFISIVPYNQSSGLGLYSGAIRWGFFQATFVPASFSLLVTATNSNFSNLFNSQTEGVDLVSGVDVKPFSFYVGAGTLYSQGQFSPSLTSSSASNTIVGKSFHTMLGVNFSLQPFFSALEVDTYSTTVTSLKIGMRL
jgi:hypothetical protein